MNTEIKNAVTFLGVTYSKDNEKKWQDLFEKVRWGDNLYLRSKEVFNQGEDGEPFNELTYRFVIIAHGADYGMTITNEDGDELDADSYSLYLVPTVDKVSDKTIEDLRDLYGMDDKTIEELRSEFTECDLADEGHGVFLGDFVQPSTNWQDAEKNGWESGWDDNVLNGLATVSLTINSLRGFWLDRPLNGIGMTGWDFLEMAIEGKTFSDFI